MLVFENKRSCHPTKHLKAVIKTEVRARKNNISTTMNRFNSILLILSVFIMAELLNAQPANYTRPPNPPAIVDEPFNATVKTIRILDFVMWHTMSLLTTML